MSITEWLEKIDTILFILIHRDSDFAVLDNIFPLLRNPATWIPLYLFLLFFIWKKLKNHTLLLLVLSLLTILLCDRLSAGVLKPLFLRERPCFREELQPFIRNVISCGGRYSFPSSHAANHFGLASLWYWSIQYATGKKWNWLWIWAAIIGYAQIYVGKHYPLDIAAGALLGVLIGTLMAKVYEHWPTIKKLFVPRYLQENPR